MVPAAVSAADDGADGGSEAASDVGDSGGSTTDSSGGSSTTSSGSTTSADSGSSSVDSTDSSAGTSTTADSSSSTGDGGSITSSSTGSDSTSDTSTGSSSTDGESVSSGTSEPASGVSDASTGSSSDSDNAEPAETDAGSSSQDSPDVGQDNAESTECETAETKKAAETQSSEGGNAEGEDTSADDKTVETAETSEATDTDTAEDDDAHSTDDADQGTETSQDSEASEGDQSDSDEAQVDVEAENGEGNSYKVEITPDGLVDGDDTGKETDFEVTFTELNAVTKLGSATLQIPDEFTIEEGYEFDQASIAASDGKSWSGSLVDRVLSLWADNEDSYLGENESVSASFTAMTPVERGAYEFKTEAWTEANSNHDGVANEPAKVNNMAAGHSDPVVVVGHGVSSADDLNDVRNNLDDYYVQTDDIDLNSHNDGEGWEPIGDEENPFTGFYHGNNKSISNLTINRSDDDYVGLFGMVGTSEKKYSYSDGFIPMDSRIYSVSLQDVNVTGGCFVGGLIGRNEGYINNVSVTGDVVGLKAVGGIVGGSGPIIEYHSDGSSEWSYGSDMFFGKISNSISCANVSGFNTVGGLIGGTYGDIKNSSASGSVVNKTDNYPRSVEMWDPEATDIFSNGFGGIIGSLNGYGLVEDSFATGDVRGVFSVGGLVGSIDGVSHQSFSGTPVININRCYATGGVSSYFNDTWFYSHNSLGGLVGYNNGGFIKNSYATGNVSGDLLLGGLVGHNDGIILNTYATGSISGGDGFTGGLVGQNNDTIINSYYDNETTGQSDTGKGIAKTTSEMKDSKPSLEIYDKWDSAVWTFSADDYPTLGADPNPPDLQMPQTHNFPGGDGSEANPYQVASLEDLSAVSFYPDAYFIQTENVDLQSIEWQPIGNRLEPFTGTYDGDGFLISNLTINEPNLNYGGLFGYAGKTAELNNVNLNDIDITGNNYIGGLAGFLYGEFYGAGKPPIYTIDGEKFLYDGETYVPYDPEKDEREWTIDYDASVVNNSHSAGFITGSRNIGGLVGYGHGINMGGIGPIPLSEINSSFSSVNIKGYNSVGGLVGYNSGAINDSHASGEVTGLSSVNSYQGFDWYEQSNSIGGLVGNSSGTVDNSYATGNVSGFSNIGGLIGSASSKVSNSHSTGEVTGYREVGGLIGGSRGEAIVDNCFATGNVTGTAAANISPYYNDDRAGQLYGSGSHQGSGSIGGLIGRNYGHIIDSNASGSISGITGVGGLVGVNLGHIDNSHASGRTHGEWGVGGLIGINWLGTTHDSYATGSVSGEHYVDQLIGYDYGFTYATGPSIDVGFMGFVVPAAIAVEQTPQALVNQTIPLLREIISIGFVVNGSISDLVSAKQALGIAINQYEAVKDSLSPSEIALVETTIAVTWAAIVALETSLQIDAGEDVDLQELTEAYQEAVRVLEMHRDELSAGGIAYLTAILAEIKALINLLGIQ